MYDNYDFNKTCVLIKCETVVRDKRWWKMFSKNSVNFDALYAGAHHFNLSDFFAALPKCKLLTSPMKHYPKKKFVLGFVLYWFEKKNLQ